MVRISITRRELKAREFPHQIGFLVGELVVGTLPKHSEPLPIRYYQYWYLRIYSFGIRAKGVFGGRNTVSGHGHSLDVEQ